MKRLLLAAIVAMAASEPAWAQSSTATGTGVGVAGSTSSSQSISGQGGTGIGVGVGGNPSATISSSSVPGRSDDQERTERFLTGPRGGRARNVPRVGFRRRIVRRDRNQLRHHGP